jgi:hypothetical protein
MTRSQWLSAVSRHERRRRCWRERNIINAFAYLAIAGLLLLLVLR